MWIWIANKFPKFHAKKLNRSENIPKSSRGGGYFFETPCTYTKLAFVQPYDIVHGGPKTGLFVSLTESVAALYDDTERRFISSNSLSGVTSCYATETFAQVQWNNALENLRDQRRLTITPPNISLVLCHLDLDLWPLTFDPWPPDLKADLVRRLFVSLAYGLVVRIPAFHVGGPGSIPGVGTNVEK